MYYAIKRILGLLLFIIYYGVFITWIKEVEILHDHTFIFMGIIGVAYIIGGSILGWLISDNVQLKYNRKESIVLSILIFIPCLGGIMRFTPVYAGLFPFPTMMDDALLKISPILQNIFGMWLFLLAWDKIKNYRR